MKQEEALIRIYSDILQISKKQNKTLLIMVCASVLVNLILIGAITAGKFCGPQSMDEAFVLSAIITKKPSEHIVTRQKLKEIPDIKSFTELLDKCILSDDERHILEQHYLHGQSFLCIAAEMGYSEDTVKHKHQRILKRIKKLL